MRAVRCAAVLALAAFVLGAGPATHAPHEGRSIVALPESERGNGAARAVDPVPSHVPTPVVRVRILEKHAPAWLDLDGPRRLLVRAAGDRLALGGKLHDAIELPAGAWRVRTDGLLRVYEGAVLLRAEAGAIAAWIEQPLEAYVADVVAAESEPGTPAAALEALAIVARSYALAARERHADGALCDLAHCQVTAGRASAAARRAAKATDGLVLARTVDGAVAQAPFHASCGGHTADPIATFGGPDHTGAAAVADPGCDAPWEATLPRALVDGAIASVLGTRASATSLHVRPGAGGFVAEVADPRSGRSATGEAFARALDRAAGWGTVRSPRFVVTPGDPVLIRGNGHGHGVGLCQSGAARRAAAGADARAILAHYFPGARVESL